jgi:hypothetical protein
MSADMDEASIPATHPSTSPTTAGLPRARVRLPTLARSSRRRVFSVCPCSGRRAIGLNLNQEWKTIDTTMDEEYDHEPNAAFSTGRSRSSSGAALVCSLARSGLGWSLSVS